MPYLLRVELPDVPGSLGRVATAIGEAGGDIEAIEIVERRSSGRVVDDVLLELPPRLMPDALITACHKLDGVSVHWISRYNAGANLSMDLEAVETFTADPEHAIDELVKVMPVTFRTDWALALHKVDGKVAVMSKSSAAPKLVPEAESWLAIRTAKPLPEIDAWDSTVLAACPARHRDGHRFVVIVGRHGGPEFLASEVARLGYMVSLAASVQTV